MNRSARSVRSVVEGIARFAGGGPRPIADAAGVVVERGQGSYLYGSRGQRYLDLVSGHGVASLGHSHPHWVERIIAQAGRLTVASLHTEELAEYLARLSHTLPPRLEQIALCSTGAEAVELALRLAQTATGRRGVLTFRDGFHGKTAAVRYTANPDSTEARSLAPPWMHSADFPACEQHDPVNYPSCEEAVDDLVASLRERDDLGDVGVVLAEPILGTAGCIPPKRPFLRALRRLCDERGWLLLLDESITGFGRIGTLYAFEWFNAAPDVLVLSKGLGGGFPLSAVCTAPDLWDASAFAASSTSSSYGGNPVACAAGLATLDIVTDAAFLEQVRDVGDHAGRLLRDLATASPRVARPRGVGLMLGFDLVDEISGHLAAPATCEAVLRECRDRGLLLPAHVPRVRLSPPLTFSLDEADELFTILHEVLA